MSSQMEPLQQKKILIYCSYAHKDNELRDQLETHLSSLKQQGIINVWHDRDISAGTEWKEETDRYLNRAHIILLLISQHFIASDYHFGIEMKRALERSDAREALVIPIILRPCDWRELPFSKLQVLPFNEKPIIRWTHRDDAYQEIAQAIREWVQKVRKITEPATKKPASIKHEIKSQTSLEKSKPTSRTTAQAFAAVAQASQPPPSARTKRIPGKQKLSVGLILRDIRILIKQNFSTRAFLKRCKGYSAWVMLLFSVLDLMALPYAVVGWLNSQVLFWISLFGSLALFTMGVTNKETAIGILLALLYLLVWFMIGMWFLPGYLNLPWPPIATGILTILISGLRFDLFRKHK